MKKYTSFTSANIKEFRKDFEETLVEVANKFGLEKIELGNIRYDNNRVTSKIEIVTKGTKTQKEELAEQKAKGPSIFDEIDLKRYGLKIGDSFKDKTKILTIVGFNHRAHKAPIELKDQNNKGFKCTIDYAKYMMKIK